MKSKFSSYLEELTEHSRLELAITATITVIYNVELSEIKDICKARCMHASCCNSGPVGFMATRIFLIYTTVTLKYVVNT